MCVVGRESLYGVTDGRTDGKCQTRAVGCECRARDGGCDVTGWAGMGWDGGSRVRAARGGHVSEGRVMRQLADVQTGRW